MADATSAAVAAALRVTVSVNVAVLYVALVATSAELTTTVALNREPTVLAES